MKNILTDIIAHKKVEVESNKSLYPVKLLESSIFFENNCVSLSKYLTRPDKEGIIAEIKRKSPSQGDINPYIDVEKLSLGYMQAGASALSILTDSKYFGGKNEDLSTARKFNFCPILRKEFIIDEYQVIEAKSIGADAILLIAAVLKPKEIESLTKVAHGLGLEVLLEIHDEHELKENFETNADLLGVNNRNLKTFEVDISTSLELVDKMPKSKVKVSESGLRDAKNVIQLKSAGYQGFLIGQNFMETSNPPLELHRFIEDIKSLKSNG